MMSRTEAIARIATFSAQEVERLTQTVMGWTQQGQLGGVYTFSANAQVTDAQAARLAAQNAGWTAVIDSPNRTITLS